MDASPSVIFHVSYEELGASRWPRWCRRVYADCRLGVLDLSNHPGVFFLCCFKLSLFKRIGWTVFFFCTPVLYTTLSDFEDYAFGKHITYVTEITSEPMEVAAATFPVGSCAHYERTGGLFDRHAQRTLVDIHSPTPVSMDAIRIDGLRPVVGGNSLMVNLSGDQILDGWSCAGGEYTIVQPTPTGTRLNACWLAVSQVWQGQTIPAGTYVTRAGDEWWFDNMAKPPYTATCSR